MVLLARTQVGVVLRRTRSSFRVRVMAGVYACVLVLTFAMETVAVYQLADGPLVSGPPWLKDVATVTVAIIGSVLILSPGFDLFRIAFAGHGLGPKLAFKMQRLAWLNARARVGTLLRFRWSTRQVQAACLDLWNHADKADAEWQRAVALGVLVVNPDGNTPLAKLQRAHVRSSAKGVSLLRLMETKQWYSYIGKEEIDRELATQRDLVRQARQQARERNLRELWRVFDEWNGPPAVAASPDRDVPTLLPSAFTADR